MRLRPGQQGGPAAAGAARPFFPVGVVLTGGEDGDIREGIESLSVEHVRSGHAFGEAELMWRCTNCGEMGEINDELPSTCPNCDARKEDLMYWTED